MEQQFQLKHHGHLSIFEQAQMTAEERAWYLKRIEKEFRDREEMEAKRMRSMPKRPRL